MKKLIIIVSTLLLLLSCSHEEKTTGDNVIFVDYENDKQDIVFNYSDFLDSVKYVPLETTDSCLIGNIKDIHFVNNQFYVSDNRSVFVFSREGKFIGKVSRFGRGHGEYVNLTYFDVNKTNGEICIYDQGHGMVHIYTEKGDFLRNVRIEGIARDFAVLPNGHFLFYTPDVIPENYRGVWQTDENGNFVNQPVVLSDKCEKVVLMNNNLVHLNDSEIGLLGPMGFDNIYHVSTDTTYIAYTIETDFTIPRKILKMDDSEALPQTGSYVLTKYQETDNLVSLIMIGMGVKQKTIIYDKTTERVYHRTSYQDNREPTFFEWGKKVPVFLPIFRSDYGICFGYSTATMLMKMSNCSIVAPNCTEDSNPILCLYYFK